ncbi:VirK/YbjX family protein [Ewingella sp. S1.OA.A_B6]
MTSLIYPLENVKKLSGLQLLSALVSHQRVPGKAWNRTNYRLKFLLRTLWSPRVTLNLLDYLAQHPQRDEILKAMPSLPCKLHRVYQSVNISRGTALKNIIAHYDHLASHVPPAISYALLSAKPLNIAVLEGKEGQRFDLRLNAVSHFDKEGETSLMLINETGESVATVTFSLIDYQGQPTLFIGAIQGPKAYVEHAEIQRATKACHGLFPKRLVMEAVMQVAELTQMTQIVAVSKHTHIYEHPRYKKRKGMVLADYDSFWETLHGKLGEDGYFHLPGQIHHRPLQEIDSKRRSEYRRRYLLLDDMQAQICQAFSQGA